MDVESLRRDIVFSERLHGQELTFHSRWGLFSPRGVDEGIPVLKWIRFVIEINVNKIPFPPVFCKRFLADNPQLTSDTWTLFSG